MNSKVPCASLSLVSTICDSLYGAVFFKFFVGMNGLCSVNLEMACSSLSILYADCFSLLASRSKCSLFIIFVEIKELFVAILEMACRFPRLLGAVVESL